ncbi:MAG TPA: diguanylate cyclase [Candidatus Omnitrophota bacterium]|nr:diguanylate cyclase [Candidatus Omnitrophota bacterium]
MYKYFIERPAAYNLERAERLANSIYRSFKEEVPSPTIENIRVFIEKYNDIPFLSVNFIYKDSSGAMKSILKDANENDILSAEYVFPIKYGTQEIGTLLVYDINKEYKKGIEEYSNMMNITRISFSSLIFLLLFILLYREYSTRIEQEKRLAEFQATHDGLTGLYNHRCFKEHLAKTVSHLSGTHASISLIMCDVDHFKKFNDTYGHLAGDEVLRTVSSIIADNVRAVDMVARYGGEEFAILLKESRPDHRKGHEHQKDILKETIEIAERIRSRVESTKVKFNTMNVSVTISMGVSTYKGSDKEYKTEYLISEADLALYESKNTGRNRITIFDPETKCFKKAD